MNTGKNRGLLGQALGLLILTVALAGCGGSSDAGGASSTNPTGSTTLSVSGTSPSSVAAYNRYVFTPSVANPGGKSVRFTIQNQPTWASFGETTGELSGTPVATDVANYAGIIITGNDGTNTSAVGPFSIQVIAAGTSTSSSGGTSSSGTASSSGAASSSSGASASPSGTMIPSATRIIDSAGNVWTVSGGAVYKSGVHAGNSANVFLLLYYGGTIYHQNTSCLWWSWNGSTWVVSGNPAVSITGNSCSAGTASAGSSSSSSSSGASVANGSPAALLNYITALSGQTKHILSGQHASYWDSNPLDYVQAATSQTGKTVAILGTTSGQSGVNYDAVAMSNAWLAQGGIPMVSWWPIDPFTNMVDNDRNIDFSQLLKPGSAAYVAWYKLLDNQIAQLKQIKGPVLYRPLLEMNGNWSWWGGHDTTQFVQVWQQMHAYFAAHGVTNVLWVLSENEWSGNYTQYYPGSAYVDIVAEDGYPPMANDPTYAALAALGKPFMLSETGISTANNDAVATYSGDNSQLLATVKASYPKTFAVVIFCQHWALSQQNGAAAFMNDPTVIALNELPSGLLDQ